MDSTIPLLKLLAGAGIGSRRKMADAIRAGRVTVNGAVAEDFRQPVRTGKDRVRVDGRPVRVQTESPVYLMHHKPAGTITTTRDERGRCTVLDILPPPYRRLRLYPVGRLDRDSTGLVILTNDGTLTHRLTHPGFEHEKEYLVQTESRLAPAARRRLEQGVRLEDGITAPAVIRTAGTVPYHYSITIHEGRKHQVRRMFESLGYRVLALKRVRMGGLELGDLREGESRLLIPREVSQLRQQGRRPPSPERGV